MPYSAVNDVSGLMTEEALIELTDDEGAGTADYSKVESAISEADSAIESHLAGRYSLPLTASEALRRLSADLAGYFLYARLGGNVPEVWREKYKAALGLLEDLRAGVLTLGVASGAETNKEICDNAFTRKSLRVF